MRRLFKKKTSNTQIKWLKEKVTNLSISVVGDSNVYFAALSILNLLLTLFLENHLLNMNIGWNILNVFKSMYIGV